MRGHSDRVLHSSDDGISGDVWVESPKPVDKYVVCIPLQFNDDTLAYDYSVQDAEDESVVADLLQDLEEDDLAEVIVYEVVRSVSREEFSKFVVVGESTL
jgi:hypothetical protein